MNNNKNKLNSKIFFIFYFNPNEGLEFYNKVHPLESNIYAHDISKGKNMELVSCVLFYDTFNSYVVCFMRHLPPFVVYFIRYFH